ncbi:MAG: DUF1674 domain-containing protein [Maricaulis sp.]|jgi:hypothetical protein|nr:DUF1674 domain-containing protein [Maricaulis sp.]MDG2044743.1 DUF1674 domain-containing protein [Maricaulis sp.]
MTDRIPDSEKTPSKRSLSPAAKRALQEAEARRAEAVAQEMAYEDGGRKGPEPTRFGDWENKGRATDF